MRLYLSFVNVYSKNKMIFYCQIYDMFPKYKKLIINNVEEYKIEFLNRYYMIINKIQNRPSFNQDDIIRLSRLGFNLNGQFIPDKVVTEYFFPVDVVEKPNVLLSMSKKYIRKTYVNINSHFLNEVYMYTLFMKYNLLDFAPKIVEIGCHFSQYYITLEYLPNYYNLGMFNFDMLVNFILKVNKLHLLNITHNDIKPDNLLLLENGNINLIDFEYCKVAYPFRYPNLKSMSKFTPLYAPPEKLKAPGFVDYTLGYGDDIWSMGITIIEAYLGIAIFDECRNVSELKKSIQMQITEDNIKNKLLPNEPGLSNLLISILLNRVSTNEIIKQVTLLKSH